jgi:hypothetical protein
MRTQDLERAIAQCKKFFVSPRTGRAVYEYDDIREVLASNKVDVSNVDNGILGRMIGRFGGFVLAQTEIGGRRVSTVQAAPERVEQLRALVASYVDKPSKFHGKRIAVASGKHERKARF